MLDGSSGRKRPCTTKTFINAILTHTAAEAALCGSEDPSGSWGSGSVILPRTELGGAAKDLNVLHRQRLAGISVGRSQAELPSAHPPAHARLGARSPWVFSSL